MLSQWCNLFSQEIDRTNYYKLGGPRSFHKFTYNNANIILIGEAHINMQHDLANEYLTVFNEFIAHHPVKLYIESTDNKAEKTNKNELSFIDCMRNLNPSPYLEVIHADKRYYNDGIIGFFNFIQHLDKLENRMKDELRIHRAAIPNPMIFPDNSDFHQSVCDLAQVFNKNFFIGDFIKMLHTQMDYMIELENKYSTSNSKLAAFIGECFLELNEADTCLAELEKKCLLSGYNEEKIKTQPIIDICIDMMKQDKTFLPSKNWLYIFDRYVTYSLDATMMNDIWKDLESNHISGRTLLVVTGETHTNHLSKILNILCSTVASVNAEKTGDILQPRIIQEFLNDNYTHAPSRENCLLM